MNPVIISARSLVSCLVLMTVFGNIAHSDDNQNKAEDKTTWVTSITQIGDSDQFAAATANGLLLREAAVMSFNASDPTALTPIYTHPAAVWCVRSTNDGGTIASVDYRGNLVTYDAKAQKATTHEKAFERWCQAMIVAPDNQHLVAGNEAGKVIVWSLAENKAGKSVELDGHAVTGLAFSPDGTQLAATDGGGHLHLLKWPGLEDAGKIEVSKETLWCVAYVDDGKKLLAGSSDRQLYRLDAQADAKPESVAKGTDWITQIAVSSSGQVAAAEIGGRLHFPSLGATDSMDAKSGIWSLCWNGDQQLFAGTRKDGIVIAGRSWKWSEVKKPEPAKTEPEKPAEESKPAEEPKPDDKPKDEAKPKDDAKAEKPADKPKDDAKPKEEPKPEDKPAEPKAEDKKPEGEQKKNE